MRGFIMGIAPSRRAALALGIAAMAALLCLNLGPRLALGLTVVVYLIIAHQVLWGALKTLWVRHRMNEEFLMSLATLGAMAIGEYPEALAVMVFYEVGECFERHATERSRDEIKAIARLRPKVARVVGADGSVTEKKPRQVRVGEVIRVPRGEMVPLDGRLLRGAAAIDKSPLTGESEPCHFSVGEEIPSGCINSGAVIDLEVSRAYRDSSISRLLALIEDAAASKSRPEALISRFSGIYTPIVVTGAALLALVPLVAAGERWEDWLGRALIFLVVSCPCALVLSVPLSFFAGLGALSRAGIVAKGSSYIEAMRSMRTLCLDKTGTLTYGRFHVEGTTGGMPREGLIALAAALESGSTHPLARAVVAAAAGLRIPHCEDLSESQGEGMRGRVDGREVAVGRAEFIARLTGAAVPDCDPGATALHVSRDGVYLGAILLGDEVKPEAAGLVSAMRDLGVECAMLTGDREGVASRVAARVGIKRCHSGLYPGDKLRLLRDYRSPRGTCGYVGDGINDAPALAAADLGIAMGQFGSEAAVEAADVVVMDDQLLKIPAAVAISRRVYAVAIENIWLSMGIKILILALGALGLANLWLAIFGDVGVCVLAVLNAMRALTFSRMARAAGAAPGRGGELSRA
ncbi:MAG: cadmium-translocating P-type ATPase [Succinivibrionaceae bacterium]|nr:cadmium-translocating P-type ATPase [Succinivibrionaceae bacterium]